jgi:hypothetical protein
VSVKRPEEVAGGHIAGGVVIIKNQKPEQLARDSIDKVLDLVAFRQILASLQKAT